MLNNLLQSKANQLSKKKFEFQGQPISSSVKSKITFNQPVFNVQNSLEKISNKVYDIKEEGHVLIDMIDHSYVKSSSKISSLHLQNAVNSVIQLFANGPIFIHNVKKSILILECHQVRLHNIHDSLILIKAVENNRIIIENCTQLRINEGIEVDDFDYPTKELENPHFKYIANTEYDEILRLFSANVELPTVDESLAKYLTF